MLITHGMSDTRTYQSWINMKQRCYYPDHNRYHIYGARGITVCKRWLNSFENFLEDMGERPKGLTLERKDNEKGYSPENCKWATVKEQCNNRRNNTVIKYKGLSLTISQWADKLNIKLGTLQRRYQRGWGVNRLLERSK